MNWISVLEAIASLATALGVGFIWWQIKTAEQQAITSFEDELVREYREVIKTIPVKALLGERLSEDEQSEAEGSFYSYVDLSNTQVFYAEEGRLAEETWQNWREGIISNFSRPAFFEAWKRIDEKVCENHEKSFPNYDDKYVDFNRLRELLKELPEIPEDEQRDAIQARKK